MSKIDNLVVLINDSTIDTVDENGVITKKALYSAVHWKTFRKETKLKTNVLSTALRSIRHEKVQHLIRKYPKINSKRKKASKNKNNGKHSNVNNSEEEINITSLIDIEELHSP